MKKGEIRIPKEVVTRLLAEEASRRVDFPDISKVEFYCCVQSDISGQPLDAIIDYIIDD